MPNTCFVIAPIGEPASETRKRADQILKHVIAPAIEPRGYVATRSDHISEPGLITSQVIQQVLDAPLVVADLTERNPNVFYELAIRHVVRKPLIQIIAKGETIPFDVANMRTIAVDHRDLDSVEAARTEIDRQIVAIERGSGAIETPVSVAIDLHKLRQSDDPESRSLGELLAMMADLRQTVSRIEQHVDPMLSKYGYILAPPAPTWHRSTIPTRIDQPIRELYDMYVNQTDIVKTGEVLEKVLNLVRELRNVPERQT